MALINASLPKIDAPALVGRESSFHAATLADDLVLDVTYPNVLKLDPGGEARDVELDVIATSNGLHRRIINAADAAENLVLKNASGDTIATVNQNEQAEVYCDGSSWILVAVTTIALA